MTWQRHREATDRDPLVHLSLARIPPVRSGLIGHVQPEPHPDGDLLRRSALSPAGSRASALETGIKMLPISITMFVTAAMGARLSNRFPVRAIVQSGLIVTLVGALILLRRSSPPCPTPDSPSAWPCSASGWA